MELEKKHHVGTTIVIITSDRNHQSIPKLIGASKRSPQMRAEAKLWHQLLGTEGSVTLNSPAN